MNIEENRNNNKNYQITFNIKKIFYQLIIQFISLATIIILGPAIIGLLFIKQGNL